MRTGQWQSILSAKFPRRRLMALAAQTGLAGAILACTGSHDSPPASSPSQETSGAGGRVRPPGWGEVSHSRKAPPDYEVVFPRDRVNQMTLTVAPNDWRAMLDNLTELAGPRGSSVTSAAGTSARSLMNEKPKWAPATVGFDGLEWRHAGLRFKGYSSLRQAWSENSDKMPFKLDFDEFEDVHPEVHNQRFYGFKQLSLSNHWGDPAFMRDALANDVLAAAGHPASATGFYEVTLDYGEGPRNLGLYTAIEVVDDTVIPRYFDNAQGHIYDAEGGPGAKFEANSAHRIPDSFHIQSRKSGADYSDLQALHAILHSPHRMTDPAGWRRELEGVFNVPGFLRWLAASALLQDWDAYGAMPRNYYLYNDPATGQLNWLAWDHNLVLGADPRHQTRTSRTREPARIATSRLEVPLDKSGVDEEWPLISFLIGQAPYAEMYHAFMQEHLTGAFEPSRVISRIRENERLLAPFAMKENEAFEAAVQTLVEVVEQRAEAAQAYLDTVKSGA